MVQPGLEGLVHAVEGVETVIVRFGALQLPVGGLQLFGQLGWQRGMVRSELVAHGFHLGRQCPHGPVFQAFDQLVQLAVGPLQGVHLEHALAVVAQSAFAGIAHQAQLMQQQPQGAYLAGLITAGLDRTAVAGTGWLLVPGQPATALVVGQHLAALAPVQFPGAGGAALADAQDDGFVIGVFQAQILLADVDLGQVCLASGVCGVHGGHLGLAC